MRQADVVGEFGWSQSSLARYERGERAPQRSVMQLLFDLYGVGPDEREETMNLYRLAERPSWWYPYRDLIRPEYAAIIDLEADASEIRTYEAIVPGLLQTPAYARQVLRYGAQEIGEDEVERRLEVRLGRQEAFSATDRPRLIAVMDEGALRREVGGREVMREQVGHLLDMAGEARTTIQVVPYSAGANPGAAGGFMLLDCEDMRVAYVDTIAGELYLEGASEVRTCSQAFEQILGFAFSAKDSMSLLHEYLEAYT